MSAHVRNQQVKVIVENRSARVSVENWITGRIGIAIQGPPGIQGEEGPIGPQGEQGVQGPVGPAGDLTGTLPWDRVTTDETTLDDELTPATDYVLWFENQLA